MQQILKAVKFVFVFFTLVMFVNISKTDVYAADFKFDYDNYYQVFTNGNTQVRHDITITNLVSDYYTANFTFIFTSNDVTNISAWDSQGKIIPEINSLDNKTSIKLNFNEKVVGLNKQNHFSIQYDTTDIANKKGNIWEIIIPGMEKNDQMTSYNVHVQVPPEFGSPSSMTPPPSVENLWTLADIKQGGINIIYGQKQVYKYDLNYSLKNTSILPQLQEIALPPDTAFQSVILASLSIKPENVYIDSDGNWMATFLLKPNSHVNINAQGYIFTYMKPNPVYSSNLSPSQKAAYTKPLKYWELNTTIDKNVPLTSAEDIYGFVVNDLSYDFSTATTSGSLRNGADYIVEHPSQAKCLDFADLFVALARRANIPAREIHGFAYTTNSKLQPLSQTSDILHAWPEYYNENEHLWIPIDPTWGNTTHGIDYFNKLDFNHIALAILGKYSDYPYPAGSFYNSEPQKNVFITPTDESISLPQPKFTVENILKPIISGINNSINLIIYNSGEVIIPAQKIILTTNMPLIYDANLNAIPPFGHLELPIKIKPDFSLNNQQLAINIDAAQNHQSVLINIKPFYLYGFPFSIILLICIIIVVPLSFYAQRKFKK
jgi:hypothetical protein